MQRLHIAAKYLRCSVFQLLEREESEDWIDKSVCAAFANYELEKYQIENRKK